MKIAVIGAMEEEITFLKGELSNLNEVEIFPYVFYTGKIGNIDVVLVRSGIGKVASGALFSSLVTHFKDVDAVINVGVSGGIKDLTKTGDIVVSEKLLYSDADVTVFGYRYGQMAKCPECFYGNKELIDFLSENGFDFKKGTILTGDTFAIDYEYVDKLCKKYFSNDNVLAVDMESTAFAQMAYVYNKRYLAIRAISDVVGETSQVEGHESSLDYASVKSNKFLLALLNLLDKKVFTFNS